MKNCISCQASIQDSSQFCPYCGASQVMAPVPLEEISQEEANITQQVAPVPETEQVVFQPVQPLQEKAKKKVKWLIPTIAVVLLVALAVGSVWGYFAFFKKDYVYFVKDNLITQKNIFRKEALSISDDVYGDDESYADYFYTYYMGSNQLFQMRNEGQLLFYPENVREDGTCDYFVYDTKTKEAQKIDSNIYYEYGVYVSTDGKQVTYVAGDSLALYRSDLEDETKILENVSTYYVNQDQSILVGITTDGAVYYIKDVNKPTMITEYAYSYKLSEDLKEIYFVDASTLYYSKEGSEPTQIAEEVYDSIWGTVEEGIYYQKTVIKEVDYKSLIEDPYAATDATLVEPLEADYETEITESDWYGSYTYTDVDWDAYYEDYYVYLDKLDRDIVRAAIATGKTSVTTNALYFYVDGIETLVAEGIYSVYDSSMKIPFVTYDKVVTSETQKTPIEDIQYLAYYGESEILSTLDSIINNSMIYDETLYAAHNEVEYNMSDILGDVENYYISDTPKGSTLYLTAYDSNYEYFDLYELNLKDMKLNSVSEDIIEFVCSPLDDHLYYFKDGDYEVADLYDKGGKIDKEVYLDSINLSSDGKTLTFISDWNYDKSEGEAKVYDGKDVETLSDDVHQIGYDEAGNYLFIKDYSTRKGAGELVRHRGNKEPKLIETEVNFILPMFETIDLYNSYY